MKTRQNCPRTLKVKIWFLKDGKMEVGSMGKKKDSDLYMTIDLVFQMDGQTTPIVVGE